MKSSLQIILFISTFFAFVPSIASAETRLLMFETKGCYWCDRWHEEVGKIYAKSPEGKIAKLKRVPITKSRNSEYELNSIVIYSPTFVLVDNKKEIGRIEGYPGADFFWGLLEKMIIKLEKTKNGNSN